VTTLTNLLLLTVWFAKRSRFATVVLGRVLGFSGLLFLSLASWGLPPLPDSVVHWLGLVPISMSENFGVMAGVSFWGNFQGEFMWNRQPTSLSAHNPNDGTYSFVSNMNLDMYQFDVLYQFKSAEAKLRGFRPFVVGGLGLSHFGVPPSNGQQVLGFSNRFSYNLGGGVKYFFTRHFGLRAEARWSPSHTTQGQTVFCDPVFGCSPAAVANKAEQGQANIGLIYRF